MRLLRVHRGDRARANGIMIVDREFAGMTPIGMKFSTLAGQIGGGTQTPGFVGIGKLYISSAKFISAEGGIERSSGCRRR